MLVELRLKWPVYISNVRPVSRLGSVRSLCCETGGGHFAFKKRLLEDLIREIVVI